MMIAMRDQTSRLLLPLSMMVLFLSAGTQAGEPSPFRGTPSARSPSAAPEPFFRLRSKQVGYVGPGREEPVPADLKAVRFGWFGPADAEHPVGGGMWAAATLAIEEANAAGGCEGLPFELVHAWSQNPWGTGIAALARMVYDEPIWAITGAPDGPSAHLVEQVVAKARLPFVSLASSDKTTNLVNVPWVFSCVPDDRGQALILARAIRDEARDRPFVFVTSIAHDDRRFADELLKALRDFERHPSAHLSFKPGNETFVPLISQASEHQPAAFVILAGPTDSGHFVKSLRERHATVPIFGGPAMGHRGFLQAAGAYAEGVHLPLLWHVSDGGAPAEAFAKRFAERFGFEPDYAAAYGYEGTRMLVEAVRRAGLNRVKIGEALRGLSPWIGITGTISWDRTGQNQRPVRLGTVFNGRIVP